MVVTTSPMTVEEFQKLPEDDGLVYHELRHGELVSLTRPKLKHYRLQARIRDLLQDIAGNAGVVVTRFTFRPVAQYELRVAAVAYISRERWERADPEGHFASAPDLVIETLPSDKGKLCLENGAQQFWIIDQDRRQIKVSTPDGQTITYRSGQEIPLPLFGNMAVAVDAILG